MNANRLSGHSIKFEGAPHDENGRRIGWSGTGGEGRAVCSCGVISGVAVSANERKSWHRDHKDEMRSLTADQKGNA